METFVPALSPLLVFSPYMDCGNGSAGWRSRNETVNGSVGRLSIGFNFTGTGVAFGFAQPLPQDWIHRLLVNDSAPPSSASYTPASLTNLPPGSHRFTLDLFPPAADPFSQATPSNASVTFTGATGYLGTMLTASAKNVTVDDTAWRTNQVILSTGWNMLEGTGGGGSNWLNTTQMDQERPDAGKNWESSVSWTDQRGANSKIAFAGEAVWVYGPTGPEGGRYEVLLDDKSVGIYNSTTAQKTYGQILYHASSLPSGNHSLTLRNMDVGRRLYFDRLVATSGMGSASIRSMTTNTATAFPTPSMPASTDNSIKKLSSGALAGIAIGAIAGVVLLIGAVLFCLWRRDMKRKTAREQEYSTEKYDDRDQTFFKWPRSSTPPFTRIDAPAPSSPGYFSRGLFNYRTSGTWSKSPSSATKNQSFVPGMPSTPRSNPSGSSNLPHPPTEDRYASFLKFSKSPGKDRTARPAISSPIPFERPDFTSKYDAKTQAQAQADGDGRAVSPLAEMRANEAGRGDGSYLPQIQETGSMFQPSSSAGPEVTKTQGWRRASVDTIGKILGAYGSPSSKLSVSQGGGAGTIGMARLGQGGKHPGQAHAF